MAQWPVPSRLRKGKKDGDATPGTGELKIWNNDYQHIFSGYTLVSHIAMEHDLFVNDFTYQQWRFLIANL